MKVTDTPFNRLKGGHISSHDCLKMRLTCAVRLLLECVSFYAGGFIDCGMRRMPTYQAVFKEWGV